MMHEEFEKLTGQKISSEDYRVIEYCYMHCDQLFPKKQDVCSCYEKNGLSFFEKLGKELVEKEDEIHLLKKEVEALKKKKEDEINLLLKEVEALRKKKQDEIYLLKKEVEVSKKKEELAKDSIARCIAIMKVMQEYTDSVY